MEGSAAHPTEPILDPETKIRLCFACWACALSLKSLTVIHASVGCIKQAPQVLKIRVSAKQIPVLKDRSNNMSTWPGTPPTVVLPLECGQLQALVDTKLMPILDVLLGAHVVDRKFLWRVQVDRETMWYGSWIVEGADRRGLVDILNSKQRELDEALAEVATYVDRVVALRAWPAMTCRTNFFKERVTATARCGTEQDGFRRRHKMQTLIYELVEDLFQMLLLRPGENVPNNLEVVEHEVHA